MDSKTLARAVYIEALTNTCQHLLRTFSDIPKMQSMTYTKMSYLHAYDITCAGKVIRVAVPTLKVTIVPTQNGCEVTFTFTSQLDDICDDPIIQEAAARLQPFLAEYFKFSPVQTAAQAPQDPCEPLIVQVNGEDVMVEDA